MWSYDLMNRVTQNSWSYFFIFFWHFEIDELHFEGWMISMIWIFGKSRLVLILDWIKSHSLVKNNFYFFKLEDSFLQRIYLIISLKRWLLSRQDLLTNISFLTLSSFIIDISAFYSYFLGCSSFFYLLNTVINLISLLSLLEIIVLLNLSSFFRKILWNSLLSYFSLVFMWSLLFFYLDFICLGFKVIWMVVRLSSFWPGEN